MTAPDVRTPGCNPASTNQNADTASIADATESGNPPGRIEAIKASFSAKKYTLHVLHDGSFCVTRWNLVRSVPDLRSLVLFGRQIGVLS